MKVQDTTRSDELPGFRAMFSEGGIFGQFGHLIQIKLILDANSVLADLRWMVCKARNQSARTSLLESIDSETIIPFAPTYLNIEVQKNIPLIAQEEGVEPSLLFEKWELFRPKITFVDVGGPVEGEIDPKDAPYVNLQKQTGYPILSADPHIAAMGGNVISIEVTTHALTYGRAAAVEYKIKVIGLGSFTVTQAMVKAAGDFVRSMAVNLKSVPTWAWLLVLGLFAFALMFEGVRKWLLDKISELAESIKTFAIALVDVLSPITQEHLENKHSASESAEKMLDLARA